MRRKSLKIYFNAPVTLTFTLICFLALLLGYLTSGSSTSLVFSTYKSSLSDPMTYVRLICHVFGHANFNHLINNLMYILLLGPILEDKYGGRLTWVIIFTAIATGLAHALISPNTALLGASGIVFAFILLASFTGRSDGIPITVIIVAILYLGGELMAIFGQDNISQLSHIIGGLCGTIMGIYFRN